MRLDSAGYQASIFNYLEATGKTFAIAETLHSMNETKKAFRLIVIKHKRQSELFDNKPKYHVIASAARCPRTASRS